MRATRLAGLALLGLLGFGAGVRAEEGVRLAERYAEGDRYRVRLRVDLSGSMTVPAAKGKPARKVEIEGASAIDYEERVLAVDAAGAVGKTVRSYGKLDFRRTLAGQSQQLILRPGVRRMVVLRKGHTEVPFSPDGPLTWGEMDVVRTDVYLPGLTGLYPTGEVRPGERWRASSAAVEELTDLEKVEEGTLQCKLERVGGSGKRRLARVSLSGSVRGVGEDGPVRHTLRGHYQFDLDAGRLVDLTLLGTATLVDGQGKEVGRIEGRFVLTREVGGTAGSLDDAALRGVKLEPDDDNTRMLYDNPSLGVRFLYGRRWRVAQEMGSQVALAADGGNGILVTVDPPQRVPTAAAFLEESRNWLVKQKAELTRRYEPRRLRERPSLDAFALEARLGKQAVWLDYYVTAQAGGGATVAARLLPADLAALRREVEKVARSVTITGRVGGAKK